MKNLLINAIATVATSVIETIEARKEIASARRDMFDYCERNGHHVTEIMHKDAIDFMKTVEAATNDNDSEVVIEYVNFPVYVNRDGNKERTNWTRCKNVIKVHVGKADF